MSLPNDTPVSSGRSENMRRVRRKNTAPEMTLRRLLHSRGWRYRTHMKELPGTPDIVFTRKRKAIFVHGCFWHGHQGCSRGSLPKTRLAFWSTKIASNQERDRRKEEALSAAGWHYLVVWQCQLGNLPKLLSELEQFLNRR